MEKKIVFFDIDGTLYDRRNPIGVPSSAIRAIHELGQSGCYTFLCTGRAPAAIEQPLRDIGFDGMIAGCGTYISMGDEELLYQCMERDQVQWLRSLLKNYSVLPVFEGKNHIYGDREDLNVFYLEMVKSYENTYGVSMASLDSPDLEVSKVTVRIYDRDKQDLTALFSAIEKQLSVIDHGYAVELVPKGFTKASGIEYVIKKLGINRKNTYAFGDSPNDREMLAYVQYGIAMGNSAPEILELCRYHTKAVYEDGIYLACKQLELIK